MITTAVPTTPPRESFSKVNPNLQIAWDSVSLGAFKTCPRKYYYQVVLGWQSKSASLHLRYGILYHYALEVYDHKRAEGLDHEASVRAALWALHAGCIDVVADDSKCLDEGCPHFGTEHGHTRKVWWDTNQFLSEAKAKLNAKTVPNLFRTVLWYLDDIAKNDQLKTVILANGKPAVELSFRYEMGYEFYTGEQLLHSGHLDRLASMGELTYVVDKKTTQTTINGSSSWGYFAKYSPDNQMSGYYFAGKVALAQKIDGIIIDAAQIAKGFSRFERGFVNRSDGQLAEWRNDLLIHIEHAEEYARQDYWPMNDTACDNYGGCTFREVCSKDPSVRETYLKSNFIKQPWDPLKVRGDI